MIINNKAIIQDEHPIGKFFKNEIQPLVDNLNEFLDIKKIKITHLKPTICNEYNQDFGGRELLSAEFNNFLDRRFNETI